MTKKEKVIQKLRENPENISFREMRNIMQWIDGEVIEGKGSHVILKHRDEILITIPCHNNDCKPFYKKQFAKLIFSKNILS